ncbi:DNA methyltransferase [Rubinisphaera margarita]|uniref:DNA methyltransferase n=1 Tax=Rubinisphaera margarita TaxID=2909586 RepID=UPI001EE8EAAC|nr:DNA methyltransferase [Rubinisphaera margarita]MCG6154630.1 site-specific DNA-methyltransferase [Rubinisphaera margarita]
MEEVSRFSTAEGRWSGVGPYYAMFPTTFAEQVVLNHTDEGDVILDPFAGRGTGLYSAAINNRHGVGIEINPVGWVYTRAKLRPAQKKDVLTRLEEIGTNAHYYRRAAKKLPTFFKRCYTLEVRAFLLTARAWLNWRQSRTDWTLMALLLIHLHGKRTDSLSNQMRQTKSMSPPYAIRWWKENDKKPPELDPVDFMSKKLDWRYAKGTPDVASSEVYLGDSVTRLPYVQQSLKAYGPGNAQLLFTSPPYCGVTNYHYDQWLRLWLLGGPERPGAQVDSRRGKFTDRAKYRELLKLVFTKSKELLAGDAVVYVRTDSRELTRSITCEVLSETFPDKKLKEYHSPSPEKTQTDLFIHSAPKNGETDIVLQ